MLITVDVLRSHNACADQVSLFAATFPDGCDITRAVLRKARKAGLEVGWIARWLPPDIHNKVYDAAMAEPRKVYDAAMDEARKVYDAAMAEARKVYYAAMDRALVAAFRKMKEA